MSGYTQSQLDALRAARLALVQGQSKTRVDYETPAGRRSVTYRAVDKDWLDQEIKNAEDCLSQISSGRTSNSLKLFGRKGYRR